MKDIVQEYGWGLLLAGMTVAIYQIAGTVGGLFFIALQVGKLWARGDRKASP